MDNLWYLHGEDFFAGLEEEKRLFLQKASQRRFQKNDIVFFEGDPGDACFYIASCLVRIFSIHDSGKEPVFFLRRAGELFGISEVLEGYPRKANAQAMAPSEIHSVRGQDFDALLAAHYPLARRVISLLGSRIRHLGDSIRNLVVCSVEGRLIKLLVALVYDLLPDAEAWRRPVTVPLRISQEQLASMCGTTQPTVSDLLQKLQREGQIRVERRRITLLHPLRLLAAVDGMSEALSTGRNAQRD